MTRVLGAGGESKLAHFAVLDEEVKLRPFASDR
jgi:hypothetical protein